MRVRRCNTLFIESRRHSELDLGALLLGHARMRSEHRWVALCAHLDSEVELDRDELAALDQVGPDEFVSWSELAANVSDATLGSLLGKGLLVAEEGVEGPPETYGLADARVRETHWRGLAAVAHRHLRWRGVDSEQARISGTADLSESELHDRLGSPPPVSRPRVEEQAQWKLPARTLETRSNAHARSTCRNFESSRALPLDLFARMLHTVYGAQGQSVVSGVPVLKKNSPSAGGLHPVEAYLLVQHVEGVAPGLYHYRPDTHALEPLKALTPDEARENASLFVAHQPWFVDAHVQVILAARFQRNFWKYRNHAKAYRAVILDAGHLSQMQYLAATELGLGAFITAAVNEGDIEDAFGLDPMQEGVIAVTGFGWRGERMEVLEFDPLKQVWPAWTAEPQG
jgi:putative peptide maturation dehydrogenase